MTKEREALKLALEALEELTDDEQTYEALERGDAAITAIKEALAQPSDSVEQEPVAWSVTVGKDYKNCIEITHCKSDALAQYEELTKGGFESIYTLHQLYTTPPKREWVGLTDDEIFKTHKQVDSMQYLTFGKAIEAKLKEKNHD
jgi:hypothetical protein